MSTLYELTEELDQLQDMIDDQTALYLQNA